MSDFLWKTEQFYEGFQYDFFGLYLDITFLADNHSLKIALFGLIVMHSYLLCLHQHCLSQTLPK